MGIPNPTKMTKRMDERGIFARERNYLWENKNDSKLLIVVINLKSCVVSTFEN